MLGDVDWVYRAICKLKNQDEPACNCADPCMSVLHETVFVAGASGSGTQQAEAPRQSGEAAACGQCEVSGHHVSALASKDVIHKLAST